MPPATPREKQLPKALLVDDAEEIENQTGERSVLIYVGVPALCTYLCGVLFLMHMEDWPFVTASYVVVQMVTTVGYGDFTVTSQVSKIFMGIYAIFVLIIMAYSYNLIVGRMVDGTSAVLTEHLQKLEMYEGVARSEAEAEKKYGAGNKVITSAFVFIQVLLIGMAFYRLYENCSCSYGIGKVQNCDDTDFKSCSATGGYVKSWADCFYMCSITLVTIGFGDLQPRTYVGRLFGMIWMLIGVASAATFISNLSSWIFEVEKQKQFSNSDAVLSITKQSFKQIDRNNDGSLSNGEYLAFTLTRYGLISNELVDEIFQQYDALDVKKNNAVTWETIKQKQHEVYNGMRKQN